MGVASGVSQIVSHCSWDIVHLEVLLVPSTNPIEAAANKTKKKHLGKKKNICFLYLFRLQAKPSWKLPQTTSTIQQVGSQDLYTWLGSPPINKPKQGLLEGDLQPQVLGTYSPWLLTTEPSPGSPSSK